MKYIVCVLLTLLLAIPVNADSCRKRVVVVQKEVAVVAAAVVTPVVATFVGVPLYQAYASPYVPAPPVAAGAYQYPGHGAAAGQSLGFDGDAVGSRLDRLERAVQSLIDLQNGVQPQGGQQRQPRVPTMPPAEGNGGAQRGAAPGSSAFAADCVACHAPGGSGTRGANGITLFGADRQWLPGVDGPASRSVYAGRMPKDKKYSDEDVAKFMTGLDEYMRQVRK